MEGEICDLKDRTYLLYLVYQWQPNNYSPLYPIILVNKIYEIRNQKVMLDSDLAELYGVETRVLNQAVKRNTNRFPEDFMFQISEIEWEFLISLIVTSKTTLNKDGRDGRIKLPYVFTEHGVLMLSSVLNSPQAVHLPAGRQVGRLFLVFWIN